MFSFKKFLTSPPLQKKSWIWLDKFDFKAQNQTVDIENQYQKYLILKQFTKNQSFWLSVLDDSTNKHKNVLFISFAGF